MCAELCIFIRMRMCAPTQTAAIHGRSEILHRGLADPHNRILSAISEVNVKNVENGDIHDYSVSRRCGVWKYESLGVRSNNSYRRHFCARFRPPSSSSSSSSATFFFFCVISRYAVLAAKIFHVFIHHRPRLPGRYPDTASSPFPLRLRGRLNSHTVRCTK